MDFFPNQRPGSSLCPRDAQSVHGDRLEAPFRLAGDHCVRLHSNDYSARPRP